MEKKRSDRKNKEAEKSNDETQDAILYATTPAACVEFAMQNRSFKFGPQLTTLELPHSPYIQIIPITDALNGDTVVKHLIIQQRIWDPKDLKSFLICLSTLNMGITKITLTASRFEPNFTEALSKILKLNPRIKTVEIMNNAMSTLTTDGFNKFCDSMEYYQFEELNFMCSALGQHFDTIFESLKYNQSIKTLNFMGEYNMHSTSFITLCKSLVANPTITDLKIVTGSMPLESIAAFKEVLKVNYIKKLTFENYTIPTESLEAIKKEFQANTSITELNFRQVSTKLKLLCSMIANNNSITKLDISGNNFKSSHLAYLHLGSNKILQDLTIVNCWGIKNYTQIIDDLVDNITLKRLVVGNNGGDLDASAVEKLLTKNTSLTEFSVHTDYTIPNKDVIKAIANGLTVNRTLRKLGMKLNGVHYEEFTYLMNALKVNNTLLEVDTNKIKAISISTRPPNGNEADDFLLDVLKTNKSLRYFTGSEALDYLEEKLKKNRDTQDKIISDTRTFINMIVLRPSTFILPIELWAMVIKYVSYDFAPIDFEQYFKKFIL